jgi:hypothetical protein
MMWGEKERGGHASDCFWNHSGPVKALDRVRLQWYRKEDGVQPHSQEGSIKEGAVLCVFGKGPYKKPSPVHAWGGTLSPC